VVRGVTWTALSAAIAEWHYRKAAGGAPAWCVATGVPLLASLLATVLTRNLGSVCFGAAVIAAVQLVQLGLRTLRLLTAARAEAPLLLRLVVKCALCCVGCLDRTVRVVSHYAFTVTVEDGHGEVLSRVLRQCARLPLPYLAALEIVSEAGEDGLALYQSLGGAAGHGSNDYVNVTNSSLPLLLHEVGHAIEQQARKHGNAGFLDEWARALGADAVDVSAYALHNAWEDCAEFSLLYAIASRRGALEQLGGHSPERLRLWSWALEQVNGPLHPEALATEAARLEALATKAARRLGRRGRVAFGPGHIAHPWPVCRVPLPRCPSGVEKIQPRRGRGRGRVGTLCSSDTLANGCGAEAGRGLPRRDLRSARPYSVSAITGLRGEQARGGLRLGETHRSTRARTAAVALPVGWAWVG